MPWNTHFLQLNDEIIFLLEGNLVTSGQKTHCKKNKSQEFKIQKWCKIWIKQLFYAPL